MKDDIRKYHALMELLSTEVRYLMNLRVLVTVRFHLLTLNWLNHPSQIYLRQLPTISCRTPSFGRSASFTAASRSNSHTYLHNALNSSSITVAETHGFQPLTPINPEKKDKSLPRFLFTNLEIDMLTRNAEDVLQFHEHLVEEMRTVMTPLGFDMEFESKASDPLPPSEATLANLEAGLSFIATKFATEVHISRLSAMAILIPSCRLLASMRTRLFVLATLRHWISFEKSSISTVWSGMRTSSAAHRSLLSCLVLSHRRPWKAAMYGFLPLCSQL